MPVLSVTIAYLITYILHTAGHFLLTDAILQKRRRVSGKTLFLCYLGMYLVRAAVYLILPLQLAVNVVVSLMLLFLLTLLYRGSIFMRLLTTAFNYVIAMTGEVGATMVLSVIFGKGITALVTETGMTIIGLLFSGVVTFALMVLCARIFFTNENEQIELTKSYLLAAFFVPTVSLGIVCVLANTALQENSIGSFAASLISAAILGINFMVFYLYKKLQKEVKAENLSKMFGHTPAGLCLLAVDDNLKIIEANDIFYDILGTSKAKLINTEESDVFSLVDKSTGKTLKKVIDEMLFEKRDIGEVELSIDQGTEKKRTVLAKFCLNQSENTITANVVDITQRKDMEDQLRVSEERYRLALTQSGKVFSSFDVPARTIYLSEEITQALGLPLVMGPMPEGVIEKGIIEPESLENYRKFYERIYAGEKSGDSIISCRIRTNSEKVLWYRMAFTSIFDENNMPAATIITYEDINEQHQMELTSKWKHLEAILVGDKEYAMAVCDLNDGRLEEWAGGNLGELPQEIENYEAMNQYILEQYIVPSDQDTLAAFLERSRLQTLYAEGKMEDSIECQIMHSDKKRWSKLIVQLIEDSYNGHLMAQLLLIDIEKEKTGILDMKRDVEELEKELENSRIKVMINQMQPHFLYNALASIRMIIKRDPDRAYDLLYDFTVYLRSNVKALSSDTPIPFEEELANVQAYLNIEMMRFAGKLNVKYDIQCESFEVIPLSIQPLVENAVKHGVFPKGKSGGLVTVRSYETRENYVVEVEDDGMGFDVDKALEENNNSYGLKNLIFRLQSLYNTSVMIKSIPEKGTKVSVVMPKQQEGEQ